MSSDTTILWFRQDLRIADNPALHAAVQHGRVVPVYIWSPPEEGDWPLGAASRWWLHHSLRSLDAQLRDAGSRLIIRTGDSLQALQELVRSTGARAVYWNRRHEPAARRRDEQIQQALAADGVTAQTFNGSLLFEPGTIRNKSGMPFQVFTAFWKTCLRESPGDALRAPRLISAPPKWPASRRLSALQLEPRIDWAAGIRDTWQPGHDGAHRKLASFTHQRLDRYDVDRNRMDLAGSSELSPHLRFGELSPRQVWRAVTRRGSACEDAARTYLAEIGWREFAYHLLVHFPHTPRKPLREKFERFPWTRKPAALKRWQQGLTGYPVVDAAMRQLWHTGWMHNRARMIVASFLTKHLLIPWQEGAAWFWNTLVDADLANNTLGWQWTAGCGADAAPFFRIFNPVSQAVKFDPEGTYIRRWVPEIAALPAPWIFKPWEAPGAVLRSCEVRLGSTYPKPIVDHAEVANQGTGRLSSTTISRDENPEPQASDPGRQETPGCGAAMNTPTTTDERDRSLRLVCKEVWGGNRRIDTTVELPGLRGHIFSAPADGGRGGDVCYLTTCGSGLFSRLFVGDVCGHGEAVATMSTLVNDILRRYMHWPDQRSILRRLNHRLSSIGFEALTTAAVVSYYPPRQWLSVSYAGHPPAWIKRAAMQRWEQLQLDESGDAADKMANLPLAIHKRAFYTRRSTKIAPGDCVLLLSDGVLEAADAADNIFGLDRLEDVLQSSPDLPPDELCADILQTLRRHTGTEAFAHDDVTLLIVECVPGPRGSTLRHAVMNRILRPRGNSTDRAFAG